MQEGNKEFLQREGVNFPGKTYADCILQHIFYFQRNYLLEDMFRIHHAHVIMLKEEGLLKKQDAKKIVMAVENVKTISLDKLEYSEEYEDLFFLVEHLIQKEADSDSISNMHIGRSRNDMGVAMYRMNLRRYLLRYIEHFMVLQEGILGQAKEHMETIMPAYTHTQPAQPTTFGHYLLAIYDMMGRDTERLWSAYRAVNQSPLGAAALATTSFPINRKRVADLLGFSKVIENSYDAIASTDYLLETSSALMIMMTNTSRWLQDFLLLATKEYSGITVADPYVQISSIMPQKRNPVSIEHARSLASSIWGEAFTVFQMIHNTPFGDIVDTEDDLQPHLYEGFEKAIRVVSVMNAVVRTMTIEKDILKSRANKHAITITELADSLTRKYDVPFRRAHCVASYIAKFSEEQKKDLYELKLVDINVYLQKELKVVLTDEEWKEMTSPHSFVAKRNVYGGPSREQMQRMIRERKENVANQKQMLEDVKKQLSEAETQLNTIVATIVNS
ncbi:argininosuccinate lyase [Bacillus sp. BP-3]|uniref:argininosuccinate lyase n=1 Tax=Bacillus sp. BP-3 TaxID=3022773 RepID=UPI00232C891F|nr:argininosuccinate lyase [Bacillus sp. BP-3]MDC2866548.1 argininosuccinate lyase [Bacillus sp. BP-3]